MNFYYTCIGILPFFVFCIGLLMWLIPGKSNKLTFRQIVGCIISFIGLICWTGQVAVKNKDKFFYESSKGPVYKVFEIKQNQDTVPTTIHDTVVVKTCDTVVVYLKDSMPSIIVQEPLTLDTNTIK